MKSFLVPATLASGLMLAGMAAAWAAPAPAPAAAKPQADANAPTDVQQIGDWTVRCFPVASTSPCDMYEQLDDKNTHQRVLSISIAYVPSANRHAIQIAVPLGVAIPKGAVIVTDNFTSPALPYRRCDRGGCYVERILDNNAIDSLSKSGPEARVKIVGDNGKTFQLRFSLNGFAKAHDAMAALAKQKAKSPDEVKAAQEQAQKAAQSQPGQQQ